METELERNMETTTMKMKSDLSTSDNKLTTQNKLLLKKIMEYYKENNNIHQIIPIIDAESRLSIRIIDWFVTNYAKKNFTHYNLCRNDGKNIRFKVYIEYKLKLKSYSKKRFDPFCRWERISIPLSQCYSNNEEYLKYNKPENMDDDIYIVTTIGQLNFFKWALENKILDYIHDNFESIEDDMNSSNTHGTKKQKGKTTRKQVTLGTESTSLGSSNYDKNKKTRKKREELSISALKSIKRENIKVVVTFH